MTDLLDLSSLKNAIQSLQDGISVVSNSNWFYQQTAAVQNTLIAGVIQNFEFVYELSIKMLRRQLEREMANPSEMDEVNYRDFLRIAAERGLLAKVEPWFAYRTMRNITAHTYDHEKAQQVYEDTLGFIIDAKSLLKNLEKRNVAKSH